MSMYPLAKSYFGVTHVAVLEHVVHSVALSLPLLHKGPLALAVTLEPEAFSGGWRVRSEFGILGYLDAAETAEFPALQRVRASGFRVATDATVELVSEDATIDVAVNLGLAPWMVPVNEQPAGSVLLQGGLGLLIDTATGQLNESQLSRLITQQIFVSLHLVEGDIVAATPGFVLGRVCTTQQQPHLGAILERGSAQDAAIAARAYCADGRIAVDVPEVGATECFSPAVPALRVPPEAPAIPPAVEPVATQAWETGLEAADFHAGLPRGAKKIARLVTLAAQPAPEAVVKPEPADKPEPLSEPAPRSELASLVNHVPGQQALAWRQLPVAAAPGRFSSESARVRARRSERAASRQRGGHHRK